MLNDLTNDASTAKSDEFGLVDKDPAEDHCQLHFSSPIGYPCTLPHANGPLEDRRRGSRMLPTLQFSSTGFQPTTGAHRK